MKTLYSFLFIFSYSFFYAQTCVPQPKVLIAGDSWAQYMYDDGTHNTIFDKFGHPDFDLLGQSLGANPGSGYTGSEYAISGSEAREWADTANYPWVDNVIAEITNNPSIETVILSIGGNDILAAKSGGGWYKDMDLDEPGSEAALFSTIRDDTFVIIDEILAVHPSVEILISSYDYPNFNTGFFCFAYACPKRNDLSRDPTNDLITDAELNQMMISVEEQRISWLSLESNLKFDNAIGLSHYYYGDGINAPGTLPLPEQTAPFTSNFYGGNIDRPSIRSNFRNIIDPIHLSSAAYEYKIIHQTLNYFMPKIREDLSVTLFSSGGTQDGWTNGITSSADQIRIGDDGAGNNYKGVLNFDSSAIPDDATVDRASIYLLRNDANASNPFTSGALGSAQIDVKNGSFGTINIENSDYSETADASDVGCFHGSVSANDYALRIDLNSAGMAAINTTGNTQFRISFSNTDANADYIDFNTGDANLDTDFATVGLAEYISSAKPFIDIHYTTTLGVSNFEMDNVILYPNPVKNNFKIKGLQNDLFNLQIITAQGQIVKEIKNFTKDQSITTEYLASGFYFLRINSNNSYKTMKFLKTN
ncbi:T9SS type A sorting domain-containing protein [Oceanihabitans sp.]|nr:T9SS type A sorting domain-containing protein [Oceanihabitans sp.]